jgi:hypothetical protein
MGYRVRRKAKRLTHAGKAVNKASLLDGHNKEINGKRSTKQRERM